MRLPFAAALLLTATAAAAQDGPGANPGAVGALDELAKCRAIAADAERLACFDRVVDRVASARASGALLAFDREAVAAERRVRFGLVDVPADAGTEAAVKAAKVTRIDSTITGVSQGPGFGLWNLQLANGQRWQTLGPDRYGPRPGASIRLLTTVTGGFRMVVDNGRPIQVKRTR